MPVYDLFWHFLVPKWVFMKKLYHKRFFLSQMMENMSVQNENISEKNNFFFENSNFWQKRDTTYLNELSRPFLSSGYVLWHTKSRR